MFILDICNDFSVLAVVLFIRKLTTIISYIVPAILVLLITIDFTKAVMASNDDDIKRVQKLAVKRIIAGLIVFFVPLIVEISFSLIENTGASWAQCYNNATDDVVDTLAKAEKEKLVVKENQRKALIEAARKNKAKAEKELAILRKKAIIESKKKRATNNVSGYYSSINVSNYTRANGIAEAASGEGGSLRNNKAGDASGKEVRTGRYRYGNWKVLARAKDPSKAEIIARCMEDCAKNNHIGYDQVRPDRYSLYDEAKRLNWNIPSITKNVETTCSSVASVCINAAGIEFPKSVYADDNKMINELKSRKQFFEIITDTSKMKSTKDVRRGDILCARSHTAVAI